MLEFMQGGWTFNMNVAIDYTASNGEISSPNSLHYINPHNRDSMNQYESAIVSVGSILENFDHDKLFPVFGFGGIPWYNRAGGVSHCFNLTGTEDSWVIGTHGILAAYKNSFAYGSGLYGPTMFS